MVIVLMRHLKKSRAVTEYGYTYLHPFDDADVIAGQGTVAVELLRQLTRPIDAVYSGWRRWSCCRHGGLHQICST